jgi:hypothetical protein
MAEVVPLPTASMSDVERVITTLIEARSRDRAETWERQRKTEMRELPGIDPMAGHIDPGLMHSLGVERLRRRMGAVP